MGEVTGLPLLSLLIAIPIAAGVLCLFVRPSLWLGRLFWKGGDEGTIDRFGPHGAAYAVGVGNKVTTRLQSGYLYSYALVMLLGLIGAASWAIWWAAR